MALPAELAAGAVFGTALLASGVYAPAVITAQLRLASAHMLQVFLGGSATSALVLHLADRSGVLRKSHRPPASLGSFPYDGNVVGGALIGLGMAATGACPGTSLAQVGSGMTNGALVALGGLLGASLFLQLRDRLLLVRRSEDTTTTVEEAPPSTPSSSPPSPGKALDIPSALALSPLTVLLLWMPMCVGVIVLGRALDWRRGYVQLAGVLPPAYGGLLIGLAQASTVLLTHHHIGASTAYEDVARWIASTFSTSRGDESAADARPPLVTPSMAFAAGIVCAAALLKQFVLGPQEAFSAPSSPSLSFVLRTVAGGASMVFGARLAGGCTSGHGISGLSKFSLASLVTTVSMFAGGMLSAQLLPAW